MMMKILKSYIRVDNNNNTQVVLALLNEITTNKLEQLDLYVYSVVHTFTRMVDIILLINKLPKN